MKTNCINTQKEKEVYLMYMIRLDLNDKINGALYAIPFINLKTLIKSLEYPHFLAYFIESNFVEENPLYSAYVIVSESFILYNENDQLIRISLVDFIKQNCSDIIQEFWLNTPNLKVVDLDR